MSAPSITILHLSDIQFGKNHRFGISEDTFDGVWDSLLERLKLDLSEMKDQHKLIPDIVVMSGDLAEWGMKAEFESVYDFSVQLADYLKLGRERFVMVPGNHDINRSHCESYFLARKGDGEPPIEPYWKKWESFKNHLFDKFYQDQPAIAFTEDRPWTLFEMEGLKVVVAGINSTMKESHRDEDHYGFGGESQYQLFRRRLQEFYDKEWLRIGVLHHNPQRGSGSDEGNLCDVEDFKNILSSSLNLVLHGHVHSGNLAWLNQRCPVLATGSASLKQEQRPEEVHNQYQLIRVFSNGFERWCRAYSPSQKKWVGDTQAIMGGNHWQHTETLAFERVSNTFSSFEEQLHLSGIDVAKHKTAQLRRRAKRQQDRFIDFVADVCRVRHKEANIELIESAEISYLKVTLLQQGVAEIFPVGVVGGVVNALNIRMFYERVVQKYRGTSPGSKSYFVCNEITANDHEARAFARSKQIFLYTFIEYQGLIDFNNYLAKQNERLSNDPVYPLNIYVPQRMHFEFGAERHEVEDCLEKVLEWLTDEKGRFILMLGDFGTGKTFLLHNIAWQLTQENSARIPVLIKMRDLEKGRTLNELIAQHLSRAGMNEIDLGAFRYMLESGRIVLLFDGFDELALRVSYDNIQAHFTTLLEAASGINAKVLVTSRTQHFKSDDQARNTALGERFEQHPNRRIAWLESFLPEQILIYLVKLLNDEQAAKRRYELLDNVKDLLGLSSNPRLLSFIAALPEEDLLAAKAGDGEISAAKLYEMLLTRWIEGEHLRVAPPGAQPLIKQPERWSAVVKLALTLWDRVEPTICLSELAEEVRDTIKKLFERSLDPDVVTHQLASGTLLIRDEDGNFGFIHQSVLEWLVANEASRELAAAGKTDVLLRRELSPLMIDFLVSLAGAEKLLPWAETILSTDGDNNAGKKNAISMLNRLEKHFSEEPLKLAGERLMAKDFSGYDYSEADFNQADLSQARLYKAVLRRANLTDTILEEADLREADLSGALLHRTNLSGAQLMGADLRESRTANLNCKRTKLIGARYDQTLLDNANTWGAAICSDSHLSPCNSFSSISTSCVAVHPTEPLIAYAGAGGILLYDIHSGRKLFRLAGHDSMVQSIAFSPDGNIIASAGDCDIVDLWDVATGQLQRQLTGHDGTVQSVTFSPDGKILASAAGDNSIRLWDTFSGRQIHKLKGHDDLVLSVAFSPDGKTLASASDDSTVRLWCVDSYHKPRILKGHNGTVQSVAFSPGGKILASAGLDCTVQTWDSATGRKLLRMQGHDNWVQSVAFSPDGKFLASAGDDATVHLWEAASGRLLHRLEGHNDSVQSVIFSPDSKTLISGGNDTTIRLWETATGRQLNLQNEHYIMVRSTAFSPNGKILASAGDDSVVRLWETATGRQLLLLEGHRNCVRSVAFSPDGRMIASAGDDNIVRLWDSDTGQQLRRLVGHGGTVESVVFSGVGNLLASAGEDKTILLWSSISGHELRRLEGHDHLVQCVAFSPDGSMLASASHDRTVRLWDTATGQQLRNLNTHDDWVQCVVFSPDGRMIASAGDDSIVKLWEAATGRLLRRLNTGDNLVFSVAFSPDGKVLACSGRDSVVRLWDTVSGRQLCRLEGHSGFVLNVAFSPDGKMLASAGTDNTVRLWDTEQKDKHVVLVHAPEGWLAYTPDGRYKYGGDVQGYFWHTVNLCRFEIGEIDPYWPTPLRMADDEPIFTEKTVVHESTR